MSQTWQKTLDMALVPFETGGRRSSLMKQNHKDYHLRRSAACPRV